ncbi:MAG: SMP-30/gluconolactonase/LRE family protein, partial [Desulfococcaceae bacterium]
MNTWSKPFAFLGGIAVFTFISLLIFPAFSLSQETYLFRRMWPALHQPWYFLNPSDLACDSEGFIYVADSANDRIQKFSSDGQFVTEWGKNGTDDGEFDYPTGIAADSRGFVYVVDNANNRVQKFTSSGQFVTKWGSMGSGDGEFDMPYGIAVDYAGNVYVTDGSNRRIQKFTEDGQFVMKWSGQRTGDKLPYAPLGIAADQKGFVYVADNNNHRIQKFAPDGQFVLQWGYEGSGDGGFYSPKGVTAGKEGFVYVTDMFNNRIQKFTDTGEFVDKWGNQGSGNEEFNAPGGMTADDRGYLYVADTNNSRIQKFTSAGQFVSVWGMSQEAGEFNTPNGIAWDSTDSFVYVADTDNDRIQKFSRDGQFLLQWGTPGIGEKNLSHPEGIAVDSSGYVYVADTGNDRILIFDGLGNLHLPPIGKRGIGDGQFRHPIGIAVDSSRNMYVVDTGNHRVQKLGQDGEFVKFWGKEGNGYGDFDTPRGITVESKGNVYVADTLNHRIQKFDSDGIFLHSWGTEGKEEGKFYLPFGVSVDQDDNVYVADSGNSRIQKFDSNGNFIEAWGEVGNAPGQMRWPGDVVISPDGKVYVADTDNHRIQVFSKISSDKTNKAIIVAGGGPYAGNWLWAATQLTANFAYRALTYQGFDKNTIFYLNPDTSVDLDNNGLSDDVDRTSTNANLEYAVKTWAAGAENVIVFLTDHGKSGTFRMNGTDILTADMLDEWLNALQAEISGKIIVIYDACSSGSFLPVLAAPDRIVISSTEENKDAWFISQGSVSFSGFFWTDVFSGKNIADAFEHAVSSLNSAVSLQNPLLDGNGNGTGNEPPDYDAAGEVKIAGIADYQQDAPVFTAFSAVISPDDANTAVLSATVTDNDGLSRVWAVIQPPDFNSADNSTILEMPAAELLPAGGDRFEGRYEGIASEGNYKILYYARDRHGSVSSAGPVTFSSANMLKRKALIVSGNAGADLQSAVNANAALAFDALVFQGYDKNDDIRSLSSDAALADLGNAVTVWAADNAK